MTTAHSLCRLAVPINRNMAIKDTAMNSGWENDFTFKLNSVDAPGDNRIRDIHRKLASIKDQLPHSSRAFLIGKSSSVFTADMQLAVKAFQKRHKELRQDGICDRGTWEKLDEEAGSLFPEVWQYELDALSGPEIPFGVRPAQEDQVIAAAHGASLAGLAFSGGGIRSATFNLGVLQALAKYEMLRDFDYLSTVSGGGYIGAWFSKWLQRENATVARDMRNKRNKSDDGIGRLERRLAPGTSKAPLRHEPGEIRFLRQYSNYLTPKTGLFSADTWALLATYFRNTMLNLTILVALIGVALMVPRLLALFVADYGYRHSDRFAWSAAGLGLWTVFYIAMSISSTPDPGWRKWLRGQSQASILLFVVAPLMAAGFLGSVAAWGFHDRFVAIWRGIPPSQFHPVLTWLLAPGAAYFAAWAAGWGVAQWQNRHKPQARPRWTTAVREGIGHFLCALVALAVGAFLLTWSVNTIATWQPSVKMLAGPAWDIHLVTFGMPLMLSVFGVAMVLTIGLVGKMYADKSREWWSRQGAWTIICTLAWFGLSAMSLYGPPIVAYGAAKLPAWGGALLASAWFGTVAMGLVLGRSGETGPRRSRSLLDRLAVLAPPLFSVGALLLVSTLLYLALLEADHAVTWSDSRTWGGALASYYDGLKHIDPARAQLTVVALIAAGLLLAWRVDINKFSLYMMYRNRLVRAYLGASNPAREAHPFTGFDEKDDVHLDDLLATDNKIQRPFHIINAALNLVSGKELAWQTRKAAAFSFTPAYCGFELPSMAPPGLGQMTHEAARGCYRPTRGYRPPARAGASEDAGIKLGMAVAVSGAAVNPNMGYHSSPALAFLMTLFNVRLGSWFANPRRQNWKHLSPWLGIRYLLSELFGLSDADARYLHLSDGGHFENLGVYELVRRRCKLIVVVDAGADGDFDFEDLGNAIRKCATDLHIDIDINVNQIERLQPNDFSQTYCVAGKIMYERTDRGAQNGTLLYIKPSLLGTECADILNYRKSNKDFPHQTTADQFFDETQFESYRALGYTIGTIAFGKEKLGEIPAPVPGQPGHSVTVLAEAIERAWGTPLAPEETGTVTRTDHELERPEAAAPQ
jgi:hypothetical protein